jgi:aspartate racemase
MRRSNLAFRTWTPIQVCTVSKDKFNYHPNATHKEWMPIKCLNEKDRKIIHKIIYQELCLGKIKANSKEEYLRVINALGTKGAEAVILGCTEIGMLVNQSDTDVKLMDTTTIHAQQAVRYAIS